MIKQQSLSKRRLLDFLTRLEESYGDCLTIYLTQSRFTNYPAGLTGELGLSADEIKSLLTEELILREAERHQTGAVIFWGNENKYLVLPPFPIPEDRVFRGKPETSLLCQILEKERSLGVVLVSWGFYAVGVFKGDKLLDFKIGTGYIHPKHRKGGRSQKRFARRTEEQKKDFLRRVAGRVEERLKSHELEQIFFGGNRLILKPLIEESSYLEDRVNRIAPRLLRVRYADKITLLKSLDEVNNSVIFSYHA